MIRIRQVKANINSSKDELKIIVANKLKIDVDEIENIIIKKQSLDARDKNDIHYVYELDVDLKNEKKILKRKSKDIFKSPHEDYKFNITGTKTLEYRPIIVGSGPAGLFCSYMLAKYGYRPIIIERGEKVEDRIKTVERFWNTGELNKECNVQFGEGGAGTFSDGKLNTLVKDKLFRNKKVLEIFVEAGAPEEILYINKPHIGTDLLRTVVKNLRNKIIEMGGEFRFNSCLTNIHIENEEIKSIEINNKEVIKTNVVVLAIGHSARDTFRMLNQKNIEMNAKSFAIGVRIQHKQSMINNSQYGKNVLDLPPASYKLTYKTQKGRGVYTFCMCPGGFVVNSSSEQNRLAINGMSNFKRDEENANSAVIVTITPDDFGDEPLSGLRFQEKLEEITFQKGNGKIPVQLFKDFKENKNTEKFGEVNPVMKGGYKFANLNDIFPQYINESLIEAINNFDKRIEGFASDDSILAAVESRTSSPVRINRHEDGQSNIKGIFPCGEGAGYAGGITSSAMDGIKIAEYISSIYKI
ncbi:MAG: NAD(P)-binding protein [Clostridia bacterium]|nr:NAD(P)-binding protein [Clostridia bacterium]